MYCMSFDIKHEHCFICVKYLQDNVGQDMICEMTEKRIFTMASHVASALVSTAVKCC